MASRSVKSSPGTLAELRSTAPHGDGLRSPVFPVVNPRWVGMSVRLRMVEDADPDQAFEWERDPGAVAMAVFTRADPSPTGSTYPVGVGGLPRPPSMRLLRSS